MSVRITDLCINCSGCINECPVGAIVDEEDNPYDDGIYYVHEDLCVECNEYSSKPKCALACPTNGCIIWGSKNGGHKLYKEGIPIL